MRSTRSRQLKIGVATVLTLACWGYAQESSQYVVEKLGRFDSDNRASVMVEICDVAESEKRLPVRAIVTASDGSHPDGSGHGVYADGRFYAEGQFEVEVPGGKTKIELDAGPHYAPLLIEEEVAGGLRYRIDAKLYHWFSPEDYGWYCGDNHVHALHDARAAVKASLRYTTLQGRANGLNWITEAGSNVPYDDIDRLDTESFLLRYAPEQRPGAYVGHVNTPGIAHRMDQDLLDQMYNRPLPVQALTKRVHELGGVTAHTHPLSPRHQLHWMGATEFFSDAVMGRCADLFDVDSRATEWMWFMALNLGNKVGASGSTDSALGRVRTSSPGDRRVYCHTEEFTYPAIVEAMRRGRTVATNGGRFFPLFQIEGRRPGDIIELKGTRPFKVSMKIHTWRGVRTAQLYRKGIRIWAVNLTGQTGTIELEKQIEESQTCWYVLRVEDERGNWAITSPIYFKASNEPNVSPAEALLLEISNCTRFIELRKQFYAHFIVTVSDNQAIEAVELLRDGRVEKTFRPNDGDKFTGDIVPVNGRRGEYSQDWIWVKDGKRNVHIQGDYPVSDTGWYSVRLRTNQDREVTSDRLYFDVSHPNSRTISIAQIQGHGSSLKWLGYGEEMPLEDITLPFEGDHWWYPKRTYWQVIADFGQGAQKIGGGWDEANSYFRNN